jgi:hypothetical protein
MFTRGNPSDKGMVNVQLVYEKMRRIVVESYDKVWIIESDMVPPKDALSKSLTIDAPLVSGLYGLRHGMPCTNLTKHTTNLDPTINPVERPVRFWRWHEVADSWGKTLEVEGTGMGCLLIDRSALEGFDFTREWTKKDGFTGQAKEDVPPDWYLLRYCLDNGFKQVADLSIVCGHITPERSVIWPDITAPRGYRIDKAA